MSLRDALLALLAEEPKSGWELTKEFDARMGAVWSARHSQIYPELARLLDAGLVEISDTGARNRKTYRVTDAGRERVRTWLADPDADRSLRSEALLKAFFYEQLPKRAQRTFLRREAAIHRERVAATVDGTGVGADLVRRCDLAVAEWAEAALRQLDASGDGAARAGAPTRTPARPPRH